MGLEVGISRSVKCLPTVRVCRGLGIGRSMKGMPTVDVLVEGLGCREVEAGP